MIEHPVLKQRRLNTAPSAPSLNLPRAGAGYASIIQVALVVLGIALATFVLYLYLLPNSQISAAEARIEDLKAQHAALVRQNAEIMRQISTYTNLGTVQQRAQKLGMGPARSVIFLPAASAQTTPTPQSNQWKRSP